MTLAGKTVIALVPARGGSKGVPRKNLRVIAGKPLLAYTIKAALGAKQVDRVYLSSDDDEILAVGHSMKVEIIRRPLPYASDTASALDVVQHFITLLPEELKATDPYIVYLQPTSPLRSARHIEDALAQMETMRLHTMVSVIELSKSPYKSFALDAHGCLQSLFDEKLSNARRQDLPKAYLPNGAIYAFRLYDFLNRGGFPSNGSLPYVMSEEDSVDVDTEEDILRLEQYLGDRYG